MRHLSLALLLALTFSIPAQAAEPDPDSRKGFFIGAGVGGGAMTLGSSTNSVTRGAGLLNVKVGIGLTEKLLLMGEHISMGTSIYNDFHGVAAFSFSAQYFATEQLYFRPGVGFAVGYTRNVWNVSSSHSSEIGFETHLATGWEFRWGGAFALSPELLVSYTHIAGYNLFGYGPLLTFNWYL